MPDPAATADFRSTAAYRSAHEFLFGRIDFERVPKMPYSERDMNLGRMRRLLQLLNHPERGLNLIHVAGTKGKGSTVALLCQALAAAGRRCGCYTSPHLHHVEERFSIDGLPCSPQQLAELIQQVRPAAEQMDRDEGDEGGPTYFELATAMAFLHFQRQQVDVGILEVGLGGRLDSTNVCQPLVTAITSISLDHTKQLGNTLAAIAAEKAGIIKPGVPIISGATAESAAETIATIAEQRQSPLWQLGRDFSFTYHDPSTGDTRQSGGSLDYRADGDEFLDVPVGLCGAHQAANAAVAIATLQQLPSSLRPDAQAIRQGFARAHCPARIEVLQQSPTVIVDAAHNVASAQALARTLNQQYPQATKRLILATTRGKDTPEILRELLPIADQAICCQYQDTPRGVPAEELYQQAQAVRQELQLDVDLQRVDLPQTAWADLQQQLQATPDAEDQLVCITGSFFLAAELRNVVLGR